LKLTLKHLAVLWTVLPLFVFAQTEDVLLTSILQIIREVDKKTNTFTVESSFEMVRKGVRNGDLREQSIGYIQLAEIYYSGGKYSEALINYERAATAFVNVGEDAYASYAYLCASQSALIIDESEKSQKFEELAYNSIENQTIRTSVLKIINTTSAILKNDGQYSRALTLLLFSLQINKEKEDLLALSDSHTQIATIYRYWGYYEKAIVHALDAVQYGKESEDKKSLSIATTNLGNVYKELKQYTPALNYYRIAEGLEKNSKDSFGLGIVYTSIGEVLTGMQQYDSADTYLNRALQIKKLRKDVRGVGITLMALGQLEDYRGNQSKAFAYLNDAIKILTELNDNRNLVLAYLHTASLFKKTNNLEKEFEALTSALSISKNYNFREYQRECYFALSSHYEKKGDYVRSLENYKLFHSISGSISSSTDTSRINEVRLLRLVNQKENTISILKKDNEIDELKISTQNLFLQGLIGLGVLFALLIAFFVWRYKKAKTTAVQLQEQAAEIQRQTKELEKLNTTKDKFFSIIAHDLRNPFVAVLGYSDMLRDEIDILTREEIVEFANRIKNSNQQLYKLVEDLLTWARLQSSNVHLERSSVLLAEIGENVEDIVMQQAQAKGVTIVNEIPRNIYAFVDPRMLQSTLTNLVTNSIKFTNRGGKIILSALAGEKTVSISVEDTGIGIPQSDIDKLFRIDIKYTRLGTDEEEGTGLGLLLVKEMVERNGGDITVKSAVEEGTVFTITLPVAPKD